MNEFEDNRMIKISFRMSPDEVNFVKEKAKLSGAKNLSSYLRKMAITGLIINYQSDEIKTLQRDMVGIKTNINQIAQRVNSTNNVYSDDIKEIQEKVEEIWRLLISIQSTLRCTKQ